MEHTKGRKPMTRLGAGLAAVLVVVLATFGVFTAVGAQTGPSANCSGDVVTQLGADFFGAGREDITLLSIGTNSRTYDLSAPLAPGEYALSAVSYDGYPNRDVITPQPQEQWFAELLAADGSVLAQSAATADITDAVIEDTWSGAIGTVTITSTATQVRVSHLAPGADGVNSVRPVCVAATEIVPEPDIPASSVTVTFQDEGPNASNIELDCGGESESARGRLVQIRLADLPGGSSCAIDYPADRVCDVTTEPAGIGIAEVGDQLVVSIPGAGGVDIQVNIICRIAPEVPEEPEAPATTTTTVAPATPATTAAPVAPVTTTTVAPIVPQVESAAATPQQANPAFTG